MTLSYQFRSVWLERSSENYFLVRTGTEAGEWGRDKTTKALECPETSLDSTLQV